MSRLDLTLGAELGRGGEGVVHALPSHPTLVAKLFFTPPDSSKRAHLEHLIAHARPNLTKIAAWPVALETLNDGRTALVAPRVSSAVQIHDFYGAASRVAHFPEATWADCVRVAARIATIVDEVHKAGFILADLNEQNFLMDERAEPVLIDCDSVMSTHDGRRTFGGPYRDEWLPPELICADLSAIERTRNHDCFSLALMLFRLLMLGRHPFVGTPQTEMPTEAEAVAFHHFVYADMSPAMRPPDTAPDFDILPPAIRALFIEAFGQQGRAERPSAARWRKALHALDGSLTNCGVAPERHTYSNHLGASCPWCELAPRFDAFPHASPHNPFAEHEAPGPVVRFPHRPRLPRPPRRPTLPWRAKVQAACVALSLIGAGLIGGLMAPSPAAHPVIPLPIDRAAPAIDPAHVRAEVRAWRQSPK